MTEKTASTIVTSENLREFASARVARNETAKPEPAPEAEETAVAVEEPQQELELEEEQPQEEPQPKKGGIQKRFSELTHQRDEAKTAAREAIERAANLERENNELKQKLNPPKPDDPGPKPKPADFKTIEEYTDAVESWAVNKKEIEDKKAATAREAEEQRVKIEKQWREQSAAARKEIPDWEDALASVTEPLPQMMMQAILESDHGARIAYMLAKDPEERARIAQMQPGWMLRAIGRLEAKVEDQLQEKKPGVELKVSTPPKAKPEPITSLRPRAADAPDLENLSFSDYRRLRREGKMR